MTSVSLEVIEFGAKLNNCLMTSVNYLLRKHLAEMRSKAHLLRIKKTLLTTEKLKCHDIRYDLIGKNLKLFIFKAFMRR